MKIHIVKRRRDVSKTRIGDVKVYGGGSQTFMSQHELKLSKVGTFLKHMRRKAVT